MSVLLYPVLCIVAPAACYLFWRWCTWIDDRDEPAPGSYENEVR